MKKTKGFIPLKNIDQREKKKKDEFIYKSEQ